MMSCSRTVALVLMSLSCALAPLTAEAQTVYRATLLPDLDNPYGPASFAQALNDRGDAVGQSRNVDGTLSAVLWRNRRVIEINPGVYSNAYGVNNRASVVGENSGLTAFRWHRGQLENLGASPETREAQSSARDINERGQIVGVSCIGDGCPALLWQHGQVITLDDLPGGITWGEAWAINNRGEIVGASVDASGGFAAAIWQGGVVTALADRGSAAIDINNHGQIVGFAQSTTQRAVLWQEYDMTVLPLPAGHFSAQARAINEREVIVGWSETVPPFIDRRAVIWRNGTATDLNELLIPNTLPESIVLTEALDINERGQIIVNASDTQAESFASYRVVLLTPADCAD